MEYIGPISNYAPYLWSAFLLSAGALVLFFAWLLIDCLRLKRDLRTLDES